MATESKRKKKPTKKQLIENVGSTIDKTLKENFIKNMIMGRELVLNEILDKIKNGDSLETIKEYIEKCLSKEGMETFENVTLNVDKI